MGKGRKFQQDLAIELGGYMSPDEGDEEFEEKAPVEELTNAELAKALLLENIPVTTADKVEKLKTRLEELLKQCDDVNAGFKFHLPVDADGSTMGFAFAYFHSEESARTCQTLINGFKLGKFEIKVYPYSALDKYKNLPEDMPAVPEPKYSEGADIDSWLFDGREQFVVRYGAETAVMWCDSLAMQANLETAYAGERDKAQGKAWCRRQVMWSPSGRYLATFHNQGIVIWGGKDFVRVANFAHPNVTHADFSPCERFLTTFVDDGGADLDNKEALIVWNVRSMTKVKAFSDPRRDGKQLDWPYLKWSPDGSYFARAVENGISVFSSQTMKLIDGKPVAVRGLASFEWSPKDNLVGYWCPEESDVPARVAVFDPINKREIRSKNLFNVSTVKLHWQNNGDFMCAQVTRHTKTKKTTFTNFELFRIRDNGCPNETLSMLETVSSFTFEPSPGVRFAVVHSDTPDGGIKGKMNVTIQSLMAVKGGTNVELVQVLEGRACQETFWSPTGAILVLASLDYSAMTSMLPPGSPQPFVGTGAFEFYDVDAKQTLANFDHYMCNEVRWDPSGRFLATLVTQPMFGDVPMKFTLENGYRLWSFQGQKLRDVPLSDFYQFLWRPRQKSLLTEKELEEIKKKLPQIMKKIEKEDEMKKKWMDAAANAVKVKKLQEFRSLMKERHKIFLEYQQKRIALGLLDPKAETGITEIVQKAEELVSEKVEVVTRF